MAVEVVLDSQGVSSEGVAVTPSVVNAVDVAHVEGDPARVSVVVSVDVVVSREGVAVGLSNEAVVYSVEVVVS